jgi:hypothetical protein
VSKYIANTAETYTGKRLTVFPVLTLQVREFMAAKLLEEQISTLMGISLENGPTDMNLKGLCSTRQQATVENCNGEANNATPNQVIPRQPDIEMERQTIEQLSADMERRVWTVYATISSSGCHLSSPSPAEEAMLERAHVQSYDDDDDEDDSVPRGHLCPMLSSSYEEMVFDMEM